LKILRINIEEWIQKWLQLLLDIFGHSVFCAKGTSTRVPTQITCQTFKEHPRALRAAGKRAGSIASGYTPSNK